MKKIFFIITLSITTNVNAQLLTKGSLSTYTPYVFDADPWIEIAKIKQKRKQLEEEEKAKQFKRMYECLEKAWDCIEKERFEIGKMYAELSIKINKKYDFVEEKTLKELLDFINSKIEARKKEEQK